MGQLTTLTPTERAAAAAFMRQSFDAQAMRDGIWVSSWAWRPLAWQDFVMWCMHVQGWRVYNCYDRRVNLQHVDEYNNGVLVTTKLRDCEV